jgi:hypothetical protein
MAKYASDKGDRGDEPKDSARTVQGKEQQPKEGQGKALSDMGDWTPSGGAGSDKTTEPKPHYGTGEGEEPRPEDETGAYRRAEGPAPEKRLNPSGWGSQPTPPAQTLAPRGPVEGGGPPPTPVADPGGPVPRVLRQNERAPQGFVRYKVRAEPFQGQGAWAPLYILARDGDKGQEEAEQLYAEKKGIKSMHEQARKGMGKGKEDEAPRPVFVTKKMPD